MIYKKVVIRDVNQELELENQRNLEQKNQRNPNELEEQGKQDAIKLAIYFGRRWA
jgi:hypothetical protein